MKRMNRFISTVVLTAFLFNTVIQDLAFGQNLQYPSDKLGVPSGFDDITVGLQGIEPKDVVDIEKWAVLCLKYLDLKGFEITRENLVKFNNLPENKFILGNTIFQMPNAQFFIDELQTLEDGTLRIEVRRKDNRYGLRAYFVEYSKEHQRVGVYPKDKPKQRSEKDKAAIEGYKSQQEGIDALITWAHSEPNVMVNSSDFFGINYSALVRNVVEITRIKIKNSNGLIPIENRQCNIIVINAEVEKRLKECGIELQAQDGTCKKIIPYGHSSNNALHMFIYSQVINELQSPKSRDFRMSLVEADIAHEIGVMFGLPVLKFENDQPVNEIDTRYRYGAIDNGNVNPISIKTFEIADLNTNLHARDYASGEVPKPVKVQKKYRVRAAIDSILRTFTPDDLERLLYLYETPKLYSEARQDAASRGSERGTLFEKYEGFFKALRQILENIGAGTGEYRPGHPNVKAIGGIDSLRTAFVLKRMGATMPPGWIKPEDRWTGAELKQLPESDAMNIRRMEDEFKRVLPANNIFKLIADGISLKKLKGIGNNVGVSERQGDSNIFRVFNFSEAWEPTRGVFVIPYVIKSATGAETKYHILLYDNSVNSRITVTGCMPNELPDAIFLAEHKIALTGRAEQAQTGAAQAPRVQQSSDSELDALVELAEFGIERDRDRAAKEALPIEEVRRLLRKSGGAGTAITKNIAKYDPDAAQALMEIAKNDPEQLSHDAMFVLTKFTPTREIAECIVSVARDNSGRSDRLRSYATFFLCMLKGQPEEALACVEGMLKSRNEPEIVYDRAVASLENMLKEMRGGRRYDELNSLLTASRAYLEDMRKAQYDEAMRRIRGKLTGVAKASVTAPVEKKYRARYAIDTLRFLSQDDLERLIEIYRNPDLYRAANEETLKNLGKTVPRKGPVPTTTYSTYQRALREVESLMRNMGLPISYYRDGRLKIDAIGGLKTLEAALALKKLGAVLPSAWVSTDEEVIADLQNPISSTDLKILKRLQDEWFNMVSHNMVMAHIKSRFSDTISLRKLQSLAGRSSEQIGDSFALRVFDFARAEELKKGRLFLIPCFIKPAGGMGKYYYALLYYDGRGLFRVIGYTAAEIKNIRPLLEYGIIFERTSTAPAVSTPATPVLYLTMSLEQLEAEKVRLETDIAELEKNIRSLSNEIKEVPKADTNDNRIRLAFWNKYLELLNNNLRILGVEIARRSGYHTGEGLGGGFEEKKEPASNMSRPEGEDEVGSNTVPDGRAKNTGTGRFGIIKDEAQPSKSPEDTKGSDEEFIAKIRKAAEQADVKPSKAAERRVLEKIRAVMKKSKPPKQKPQAMSRPEETPTAAIVGNLSPINLVDHRILNAMLEMLFEESRAGNNLLKGFITVDRENKIYWFENKGKTRKNFLAIFDKLVDMKPGNGYEKRAAVTEELERRSGCVNVTPQLVDRLRLQIEHFGVETGWIYASIPSGEQITSAGFDEIRKKILAHVAIERGLHKAVIQDLDMKGYREWRRSGKTRLVELVHQESGMRINQQLTYNQFAELAHRIAQQVAPYGDDALPAEINPQAIIPGTENFEAPVAAATGDIETGSNRDATIGESVRKLMQELAPSAAAPAVSTPATPVLYLTMSLEQLETEKVRLETDIAELEKNIRSLSNEIKEVPGADTSDNRERLALWSAQLDLLYRSLRVLGVEIGWRNGYHTGEGLGGGFEEKKEPASNMSKPEGDEAVINDMRARLSRMEYNLAQIKKADMKKAGVDTVGYWKSAAAKLGLQGLDRQGVQALLEFYDSQVASGAREANDLLREVLVEELTKMSAPVPTPEQITDTDKQLADWQAKTGTPTPPYCEALTPADRVVINALTAGDFNNDTIRHILAGVRGDWLSPEKARDMLKKLYAEISEPELNRLIDGSRAVISSVQTSAEPETQTKPGNKPKDLIKLIAFKKGTGETLSAPKLLEWHEENYDKLGFEKPAKHESALRTVERNLFDSEKSLLAQGLVQPQRDLKLPYSPTSEKSQWKRGLDGEYLFILTVAGINEVAKSAVQQAQQAAKDTFAAAAPAEAQLARLEPQVMMRRAGEWAPKNTLQQVYPQLSKGLSTAGQPAESPRHVLQITHPGLTDRKASPAGAPRDMEIDSKAKIAKAVGTQISEEAEAPYTLAVPAEMFKNGEEFKSRQAKFIHRFNLTEVGGFSSSGDKFVDNLFNNIHEVAVMKGASDSEEAERTIAIIPKTLDQKQIQRLKDAKIRFIPAGDRLAEVKGFEDGDREAFQVNTFAMMVVARHIKNIDQGSIIYQMLRFYFERHLKWRDGVLENVDACIQAVIDGNINVLNDVCIEPTQPKDAKEEHERISRPLIYV